MQLIKLHGLGNDFLIAEAPPPANGAELARAWCHRTRGIGADGLIFLSPSDLDDVHSKMVLFNADGSPAEISGNGVRCAAAVTSLRTGEVELAIETAAGVRACSVGPGSTPLIFDVSVDMGRVGPGPALPPDLASIDGLFGGIAFGRVETADVGNPHVVVEVDDLDKVDVAVHGPALEALWAGGINVHFSKVTGPDEITLLHWERGAGVTEACGTGATVAATLSHRWGAVGPEVTVRMPGGSATVLVGAVSVLMGPVTHVATAEPFDG